MQKTDKIIQIESRILVTDFSAGLVIGVLEVFFALSFAALIFSGQLAPFVSSGIKIALLGMAIIGAVIAGFSSLSGMIAGSQSVPVAIASVMAAAIAAEIPPEAPQAQTFITVMVAIALATMSTGLFFWGIGHFQFGGLVRFLPYPVAGGFLAATGWLILTGSIDMMTGLPVSLENLLLLFQPASIAHWLPGLLLAIFLFMISRKHDHYLIILAFLVSGVILFYIITWAAGLTLAELADGGWLLISVPAGQSSSMPELSLSLLTQIDWSAIIRQSANILAIITVSAISLLLNAQGLEISIDCDLEINRELRVAGIANILAGLVSGFVGYKQLSLSTLNFKLGGQSRITGLIAAGICVLAAMIGVTLLAYFPKIIIGSLLLYLGIGFLYEWVIEGFFKLPKIDFAIVLIILVITMIAGFLQAVALGLLLAVILFVVSYSQVDVVHHELDAATFRSRVARSRIEEIALINNGQRVFILQLQGFIFFGTANNILNRMRARIYDPVKPKPDFIALDFKRVTGLDSTGLLSFNRMKQLTQKENIALVLTEPNDRVFNQLVKDGLQDDGRLVRIFPRLDAGAEWYEQQILLAAGATGNITPSLEEQLRETLFMAEDESQKASKIKSMMHYFDRLEIGSGEILIKTGDAADNLYFIESGQLTAQLNIPGQAPVRLETSGSGNVFGEIGFYLGQSRTADVVAETPCVLYRLSLSDLRDIGQTDPDAASTLHQIIAYLLAERMVNKTTSIKSLES